MLPIIFQNSLVTIYSYPLFWGLAWGVATLVLSENLKRETNFSTIRLLSLLVGIFAFSWIGAKLLFLLTLSSQYPAHKVAAEYSFWMGGGFVFYGGVIGGILYLFFWGWFQGFSILKTWLPYVIIALCFGHGIGRIGCFLAGCCFGREVHHSLGGELHGISRFPVQLLESIALIALGYFLYRKFQQHSWWWTLRAYIFAYGSLRFVLEYLRADPIRGFLGPLSTSQWVSLGLVAIVAIWQWQRCYAKSS